MPAPANSRRAFLKSSASAALLTATPMILNASDKAGTKTPTVGTGEFVYECIHNWGHDHLSDGQAYGNASHGVAVDSQGMVYITHQGNPGSIFVFDADGAFVRAMGDIHHRDHGRGHGIDIRIEGTEEFLYLAPSDSRLFFTKMTTSGEVVWKRGREELNKDSGGLLDEAKRYRPTNTSFRPDGGYYLGDGYGSNYIFEYDKDDNFVRALGGAGSENGQFRTPHGHWLDDRGTTPALVVADRANERLQWFDLDGNHLQTLGGFLFPADIDVQGDLMLVPDLYTRITILGKDNSVVAQLGEDEQWRTQILADKGSRSKPENWKEGLFVHPHDACFDSEGNIFVAEWVAGGRVTKLRKVS